MDVRDKTDFKLKNEGVLWTYDHPLDRQTLYLHNIQEKYMKSIKNVFKSFVVSINLSIFALILSVGAA